MSLNNHRCLLILTTAIFARFLAVVYYGDQSFENEWGIVMRHILAGDGFSYWSFDAGGNARPVILADPAFVAPSAYMPPLYIWFITSICFFVGTGSSGLLVVQLAQVALSLWFLIATYRLAEIYFGSRIASLSLAVCSVYPMLVYLPGQISSVNLYLPLTITVLLLLEKSMVDSRHKLIIYTGIASGLLVLARAEFLLFIPLMAVLLMAKTPSGWSAGALFLSVVCCSLSPWLLRNFLVFGMVTPLTLSGGINLWEGHNENAVGTRSEYTVPIIEYDKRFEEQLNNIPPNNRYEISRDEVFKQDAIKTITSNPEREPLLFIQKLRFFVFGFQWSTDSNYPGTNNPLYWAPWLLVLAFSILGVGLQRNHFKQQLVPIGFVVITTCIVCVFFVLPRYRIIVLPFVLMYASVAVATAYDWMQSAKRR